MMAVLRVVQLFAPRQIPALRTEPQHASHSHGLYAHPLPQIDYFDFADIDPVFDYYSPVIIGNDAWLEENPEEAKAFVAALSKGYTYCVEHPKEAADILMEAAPELKANAELVYRSQEYLAGEYIADAQRWGEIDPDRWGGYFTWLNDNGLMEVPLDPAAGFTNDYLP